MIPFAHIAFGRETAAGSAVNNQRLTAGDMQSGTDRRVLAGDMQSGTDARKITETI